jgi:hypothetical protein
VLLTVLMDLARPPGRRNENGACYSAAPKKLGSWESIKVAMRRKHVFAAWREADRLGNWVIEV